MKSTLRRRSLVSALLALSLLVPLASPVAAIPPINHESPYLWGSYGVHLLIDGGEPYYGVSCHYSGSQLDEMGCPFVGV